MNTTQYKNNDGKHKSKKKKRKHKSMKEKKQIKIENLINKRPIKYLKKQKKIIYKYVNIYFIYIYKIHKI